MVSDENQARWWYVQPEGFRSLGRWTGRGDIWNCSLARSKDSLPEPLVWGLAPACPATHYPERPSVTGFPSNGLQGLPVALTSQVIWRQSLFLWKVQEHESDKPDGRQFPLGRAFQRFEFLYLFMFWREGLRKVGESEEHRLLGSVGGLCHPWNVRITMWPGTRGSLGRGGCWQRPGRARGATVVNRPTEMAEEWAVKPWTSLELIHLLLAHCQGGFCLCCLPLLACCLCAANEAEPCQCSGRLWSAPPFSGCDKEIRQTAEMGRGGGLDGGLEGQGRLGKSLSSLKRLGHEQCCEQKHCTACRGWEVGAHWRSLRLFAPSLPWLLSGLLPPLSGCWQEGSADPEWTGSEGRHKAGYVDIGDILFGCWLRGVEIWDPYRWLTDALSALQQRH